jgi:hypothetical protein
MPANKQHLDKLALVEENKKTGGFFGFLMYFIQHCFICRPTNSTLEEGNIERKIPLLTPTIFFHKLSCLLL